MDLEFFQRIISAVDSIPMQNAYHSCNFGMTVEHAESSTLWKDRIPISLIPHNIISVRQVVTFTLNLSFLSSLISIMYKICMEFRHLVVNVFTSF